MKFRIYSYLSSFHCTVNRQLFDLRTNRTDPNVNNTCVLDTQQYRRGYSYIFLHHQPCLYSSIPSAVIVANSHHGEINVDYTLCALLLLCGKF